MNLKLLTYLISIGQYHYLVDLYHISREQIPLLLRFASCMQLLIIGPLKLHWPHGFSCLPSVVQAKHHRKSGWWQQFTLVKQAVGCSSHPGGANLELFLKSLKFFNLWVKISASKILSNLVSCKAVFWAETNGKGLAETQRQFLPWCFDIKVESINMDFGSLLAGYKQELDVLFIVVVPEECYSDHHHISDQLSGLELTDPFSCRKICFCSIEGAYNSIRMGWS